MYTFRVYKSFRVYKRVQFQGHKGAQIQGVRGGIRVYNVRVYKVSGELEAVQFQVSLRPYSFRKLEAVQFQGA